MNILDPAVVRTAVKAVRETYLARPFAYADTPMCLFELNNGLCDDFARDVVAQLGLDPCRLSESDGLMLLQTDCFQRESDDGSYSWDRELLRAHWGIDKPHKASWRRLDDIEWGHHVWLAVRTEQGHWLHFDAECPNGVASFFELPLFRRYVEGRWPPQEQVRQAPSDHIF